MAFPFAHIKEMLLSLPDLILVGILAIVVLLGAPLPAEADEPSMALSGGLAATLSLGQDEEGLSDPVEGKEALHANAPSGNQLVNWRRYAGGYALETMDKIVRAGWKKSDAVVIATKEGYWDAISASSLAGLNGAPVLLTNPKVLSDITRKLIADLGASKAYICGGTSAISMNVQNQIKAQLSGKAQVVRLWGYNAAGTSAAIARHVGAGAGTTCIIATDAGFWDSLAASPYAYATKTPILLARNGQYLNENTLAAIRACGFTQAVIAGGTLAVAPHVESQLKGLGMKVSRVAGYNTYSTAERFAAWSIEQGMKPERMGVATSYSYQDALTGGALCGKNNAVLLLADDVGHINACNFATQHRRQIKTAFVFGGNAAVGNVTFYDLQSATLEAPVSTYTVKFAANGGSGSMAPQTMRSGQRTKIAANAFARSGYVFAGWNTRADGKGSSYANAQMVTSLAAAGGSITLYAQWRHSASYLRSQLHIVEMYRSAFVHGPKPASVQKYIMLHDTEGDGSPESVVNWWSSNGAGVAAHFVVGRDGRIVQCVSMDKIAHHAGYGNTGHNRAFGVTDESRDDKRGTVPIGSWAADYGMNSYSIGIEMVHVGGERPTRQPSSMPSTSSLPISMPTTASRARSSTTRPGEAAIPTPLLNLPATWPITRSIDITRISPFMPKGAAARH